MFRNKFRVKGGIYTNNVPLHHKRNLCATTKLVISVNCARSRVHNLCRYPTLSVQIPYIICVDTLHHLCRVCAMSLLFKCVFYSQNIHFLRIEAFHRLILFRNKFRVKGGIYTNNVPPCKRSRCETTKSVIPIVLRPSHGVRNLCRYPTLFVQGVCCKASFLKHIIFEKCTILPH